MATRASLAAITTALPARWVVRLAPVPLQWGPVSVSPVSTITVSSGTPRVSAASCAITVFNPWPRSTLASATVKAPDGAA